MSFIGFLKSLPGKVHEALVKLFGQSAIDTVEAQLKLILQDDVRVIFTDAVEYAQSLNLSGAEKRAAAFAKIVADLKGKGVSLADNVVNLGIELIVGLLKAKTPA